MGPGSRVAEAWHRRDPEAIDLLLAACDVASVRIPSFGVDPQLLPELAADALHRMRSRLDGKRDSAIADGLLAVGLYFHALLGWEGTDDFGEIDEFVQAALAALRPVQRETRSLSVQAASQMLGSVTYQCQ